MCTTSRRILKSPKNPELQRQKALNPQVVAYIAQNRCGPWYSCLKGRPEQIVFKALGEGLDQRSSMLIFGPKPISNDMRSNSLICMHGL